MFPHGIRVKIKKKMNLKKRGKRRKNSHMQIDVQVISLA